MHNALNEGQMPSNGRGEQPKPPSPKVAAQMPPGTDEIHVHFLNLPKFSTFFTCASLPSRCFDVSWCIETISSRRQRTWPSSLCSSLASPGMPIMRWCSIRRTEKIHTWAFCLNRGSSKYTCNANSECNTSVKNFLPSNDQYLGLPASFSCECLKFWFVKLPLSISSQLELVSNSMLTLFFSLCNKHAAMIDKNNMVDWRRLEPSRVCCGDLNFTVRQSGWCEEFRNRFWPYALVVMIKIIMGVADGRIFIILANLCKGRTENDKSKRKFTRKHMTSREK